MILISVSNISTHFSLHLLAGVLSFADVHVVLVMHPGASVSVFCVFVNMETYYNYTYQHLIKHVITP